MMRVSIFGLIAMLCLGSCINNIHPMRYIKNGIEYSCQAEVIGLGDTVVTCFDSLKNKILIDTLLDGKMNGGSEMWYSSGQVKLIGNYENNNRVGIWKSYYEGGILQEYNYYDSLDFVNIYRKTYNSKGELYSLIYPIKVSVMGDTLLNKGDTANFLIELEYSEFENPSTMVVLENDSGVSSDTLYFVGRQVPYPKKLDRIGKHVMKGTLFELNNQEYGGERYFEHEYFVFE